MPIFPPPEIDPALTEDVQRVVDSASRSMTSWLNTSFEKIEQSVQQELDRIQTQIADEEKKFQQEDVVKDRQILEVFDALLKSTRNLSPKDADNKAVIDGLDQATQLVRDELAARSKRWQGYGSTSVKLARQVIKTAVGGLI